MARHGALVSLHVAVLLFGFAGLFGKWIVLPATTIVLGRTGFAALALAAWLVLRRQGTGRCEWRFGSNGVLLAAHWVAFFQAIQTASVAIGLLGFASFPVFVLLLESVVLRRRASPSEWACGAIVAVGLALLVPDFEFDNRVVRGLLWGVMSGFSFALLAVSNRALAARRAAPQIAFWQNACAALVLAPALLFETAAPLAGEIAALLVLGVVCTALAHSLFIFSMRTLSAHTASVVASLEPVYGIILAALLLGEWPDARTALSAIVILGASAWASARAVAVARTAPLV
ncbi:MAG: DMT family transporter [Casimicrobiaceae bacterium]